MKYGLYISALAVGAMMASCADELDQTYSVKEPQSLQDYAYLKDYQPLKEYLKAGSTVKLGGALAVSDFNKFGVVYEIAASNFNEVVAGNAMKMSSCVDDKGNMQFATVTSFVENAEAAGLSVFGHTLAWHSQQPIKWLNKIIADKEVDIDPNEKVLKELVKFGFTEGNKLDGWGNGITFEVQDGILNINSPGGAQNWQSQVCYSNTFDFGETYVISMKIKGTAEGVIATGFQNPDGYKGCGDFDNTVVTTDWEEITISGKCTGEGASRILWSVGDYEGIISISEMTISKEAAPLVEIEKPYHVMDFAGGETLGGWGDGQVRELTDGIFNITSPGGAQNWQSQVCYQASTPFENGETYYIRMRIKATSAGSVATGFQNPDGYKGCGDFNATSFTTDWQDITISAKCNGDGATRILWNVGDYDGTISISSMEIYTMQLGNGIPLSDDEKKDTLTYAMDKWIAGMMAATKGKVKAWDVVNEALSGADTDNDNYYDLQHAATASADDQKNNFYWQDYLGDIDYVRTAVSAARRGFVAAGGNAEELKLFINDYNLESTWDKNHKLKSLVNWISKWENDTIKIDGIGSQMHISYNENAEKQKVQEEAVVNMLTIMAQTGKLVRISELDMGYVDADGLTLTTKELTEEQHKAMANFYKFIIEKYFEIVPAAQQYGICQWCLTDSPDTDGAWRRAMPTGLWDANYNRKHTYGGFADGLNNAKQ